MRLVFGILLFFVASQFIGIYAGTVISKDIEINPYVSQMVVNEDIQDPLNSIYYTGFIIVGAFVMIILIRFFRHDILFKILEFFIISSSSSIVFYAILRVFLLYESATEFGIFAGLIFAALKLVLPKFKNVAAVLATAGVGVIFGISFGIVPAVLFLVLLCLYDVAAVFMTKHMVEMAEFMIKQEMAFTVTAKTAEGPRFVGEERKRMDLGTGDMIAPIMLEVAVLPMGLIAVVMVFTGAVLSLGIFLYYVSKKKVVLPALPPIVLGALLFFMIGLLLNLY